MNQVAAHGHTTCCHVGIVTASFGHSAANAADGSRFGCGVGRAVSFSTTLTRPFLAAALMIACGAGTVTGAGDAMSEFTKNWNGRRVVVTSALYTVVYDEVGRMGVQYRGKLAGLTVATSAGQSYEFDGPGSDEDIVEATPSRVVSEMSLRFRRAYHLDIGTVKTITPVLLRQFEPGVALIVDTVKVERNRVRLEFRQADDEEAGFATSLTVEWPVPLSKAFRERELIEGVIRRFIAPL